MFRLLRMEKKGKVRWRMMLFLRLSFIFCLSVMICAQFTGDTSSSFNDVKSFSLPVQTCGDFQYTDDDCRYDERWDQSDLHITNQTDTSGTVCAPLQLYAELENKGKERTVSDWKWELHKIASQQQPLRNGNVVDKGLITDKKAKRFIKLSQSGLCSRAYTHSRFTSLKGTRPTKKNLSGQNRWNSSNAGNRRPFPI